jgi:uncharacterized damage-inducible protein DinB
LDALIMLRDQAAVADDLMAQVIRELTAAQAAWRPEGSTANPIAATLMHVYSTEDRQIQGMQVKQALFESRGWQDRLGTDPNAGWASAVHPDPDALRAYAAAVRAASHAYLNGIDSATLDQEIDSPRGKRPLAASLALLLVTHKLGHMGEISALLGCQGVKGFPF